MDPPALPLELPLAPELEPPLEPELELPLELDVPRLPELPPVPELPEPWRGRSPSGDDAPQPAAMIAAKASDPIVPGLNTLRCGVRIEAPRALDAPDARRPRPDGTCSAHRTNPRTS